MTARGLSGERVHALPVDEGRAARFPVKERLGGGPYGLGEVEISHYAEFTQDLRQQVRPDRTAGCLLAVALNAKFDGGLLEAG